jgi:H+-transporting ATPase
LFSCFASREEDQDPIDTALIKKAKEHTKNVEALGNYILNSFKPFDPQSKRTESNVTYQGKTFSLSKGAPQVILALVKDDKVSQRINSTVEEFANNGYRTLGVAKKEKDRWSFVGLIPLYDPPREDSAKTIETAQSMGIKVKMVTGDHIAIAKEIAGQVSLGKNILPATDLMNMSDIIATAKAEECDGFAEVYPEHKYHIVDLLQKNGHICGMTGDGVNDAPALKKADAGIAVAGATDAAKAAADIVLTKPGLSVIIDAIKQSRKIFQRMNSYALYRIAETIRVLFFIALCIICFNFYPVTAMMIVLLALFNDAPIMAIAYDNVKYSNKPEQWNMREVIGIATFLGIIGVMVTFSLFYIAEEVLHLDRAVIQSLMFLKLAVAGHLTIFMTRTKGAFWSIAPAPCLLWSAVATKLLATLVVVYGCFVTPIGWKLAGFVWAYAIVELFVTDWLKVKFIRVLDHEGVKFSRGKKTALEAEMVSPYKS